MSSPPVVDVFWSFRSPYSYLAAPRLCTLKRQYKIDLRFRPVLPLLVRKPELFAKQNPMTHSYMLVDVPRMAELLDLPYQRPNPEPVPMYIGEDGGHRMNKEQPYIYRLTYLAVLAQERGRGVEFAEQVSGILFSTDDWHKGTHLADATRRAGLDLSELDGMLEHDWSRLEAVVEANQQDLAASGHWGVPTCVYGGEPFFGQDRLSVLLWRLLQNGVEKRPDADQKTIEVEELNFTDLR